MALWYGTREGQGIVNSDGILDVERREWRGWPCTDLTRTAPLRMGDWRGGATDSPCTLHTRTKTGLHTCADGQLMHPVTPNGTERCGARVLVKYVQYNDEPCTRSTVQDTSRLFTSSQPLPSQSETRNTRCQIVIDSSLDQSLSALATSPPFRMSSSPNSWPFPPVDESGFSNSRAARTPLAGRSSELSALRSPEQERISAWPRATWSSWY